MGGRSLSPMTTQQRRDSAPEDDASVASQCSCSERHLYEPPGKYRQHQRQSKQKSLDLVIAKTIYKRQPEGMEDDDRPVPKIK